MKQLRFSLWALVAFCLGHPAIAQTNSAVAAKHCFWKVQGKTNSVYLLGSIHFLNKDFYPLAQPIEDAFKKSATVVFEADLGEMEGLATQMKILQDGQYPEGETLEQNISKETFQLLQKAMADSPLLPMMSQFRPWMAAVMIEAQQLLEMGFNPQNGVDHYFYDRAADKKIVGLETVEFQIGLFKGLSKQENEMFLKETIQEMGGMKKIMSDLVNAWKAGDTKNLQSQVFGEMQKFPAIYKKFLTDRNKNWIPKLENFLKQDKDVFVVVGAGHLLGSEGVVELLRTKGYKVEQM